METDFNKFILSILQEAEAPPVPPKEGEESEGDSGEDDNLGDEMGPEGEFDADDIDLDDLQEEPVFPEEIELAKMAVRALFFNPDSKSIHKITLKVGDNIIPFEKVSDYFEETKNWKPVLGFVEFIMDKFEGLSSKWTEQPDVRGKGILDKIKAYNKNKPLEERLDNGKRMSWVRIILNCLLLGRPTYNLNTADVNSKNIKEVYRKLKQDFGSDTRGMMPNNDLRGPGIF